MYGTGLNTFAINADGIITLTNKQIKGVATPIDPSDAVNLAYTNQFATNTSLSQFIKSSSTGSTLIWNSGILDVCVNTSAITFPGMQAYVDPSLLQRDASITQLYQIKVNNASLGIYATNASVGTALAQFIRSSSTGSALVWNGGILDVSINISGINFADMKAYVDPSLLLRDSQITNIYQIKANNASLGIYATNASVNLALNAYATNASIGLAGFTKQSYIDGSLAQRDISILWLQNNKANLSDLYPYATNASVGLVLEYYATSASIGLAGFATNASIGLAEFVKNASLVDYATNASIGLAGFATDISINNALTQFIKSTSTGTTLYWNAGILDVSVVPSAGPSFSYIDGSLLTRDSSIDWLFANKLSPADLAVYLSSYATITYADGTFATNVSVNNTLSNYYDSSTVDLMFGSYTTQIYVDGSLTDHQLQINSLDNRIIIIESSTGHVDFAYVDGSLAVRDASITTLFNNLYTTDNSLDLLTLDLTNIDTSLYVLTIASLDFATNSSINSASFAKNSSVNFLYNGQLSQDASISLIRGDNATQQGQINTLQSRSSLIETSIAYLNLHSVKDSSLSNDFAWIGGVLEVSIAAISDVATNASMYYELGIRDSQIIGLSNSKADLLYVDGSLDAKVNKSGDTMTGALNINSGGLNIANDISLLGNFYIDNAVITTIDTSAEGLSQSDTALPTSAAIMKYFGNSLVSGTANSIPKYNLSGNALADTSIYQIDASIYIGIPSGITQIYSPRLVSPSQTSHFWFNGNTPEFVSGTSQCLKLSGTLDENPGFVFNWNSTAQINTISLNNSYAGTPPIPTIQLIGGQGILAINGTKGGNTLIQGGQSADPSYGGGDVILSGGVTGTAITGKIKLLGLDTSTRSKLIYFDPDSSAIGYGDAERDYDASIASIENSIISIEASIANIEASLNNVIDGDSIYVPNASLGTDFFWQTGLLEVSVGGGVSTLSSLTDVSIVSLTDNDLLKYDSSVGKWKNIAGLDASNYFQAKITKDTIPGSSTTGNAGDWAYDSSYLYFCTSTNTWGRILMDFNF